MVGFSVTMAILATALMLPLGVVLAWFLARRFWWGKWIIETVVTLPLVLPPVATGLILLRLFGHRGMIGGWLDRTFGWEVIFSWRAVVVAMAVISFPLLVRTVRVAFEGVNPRLEAVARTLGAGPVRVFFTVTLPLASRGVIGGAVLAFARALGEFGATILVAGNIPGKTATLSVSIYTFIQLGQDDRALILIAISIALAFGAVGLSEWLIHSGNGHLRRLPTEPSPRPS